MEYLQLKNTLSQIKKERASQSISRISKYKSTNQSVVSKKQRLSQSQNRNQFISSSEIQIKQQSKLSSRQSPDIKKKLA